MEWIDWAHDKFPGLHSTLLVASCAISVGLYVYDTFTDWDLFVTVASVTTCDVTRFATPNASLSIASQHCFAVENASIPCARHYFNVVDAPENVSVADFEAWKASGACIGHMCVSFAACSRL